MELLSGVQAGAFWLFLSLPTDPGFPILLLLTSLCPHGPSAAVWNQASLTYYLLQLFPEGLRAQELLEGKSIFRERLQEREYGCTAGRGLGTTSGDGIGQKGGLGPVSVGLGDLSWSQPAVALLPTPHSWACRGLCHNHVDMVQRSSRSCCLGRHSRIALSGGEAGISMEDPCGAACN